MELPLDLSNSTLNGERYGTPDAQREPERGPSVISFAVKSAA